MAISHPALTLPTGSFLDTKPHYSHAGGIKSGSLLESTFLPDNFSGEVSGPHKYFVLKLSLGNEQYGYLGQDGAGWCILVDRQQAQALYWNYEQGGLGTLSLLSYNDDSGQMYTIGISTGDYLGFYEGWTSGADWDWNGSHLQERQQNGDGQVVSIESRDNGYIYCYSQYSQLNIAFEPV